MRKTVEIVADLCREHGLTEWRQSAYNLRQLKKLYRKAQKRKHSTSKEDAKREAQKVAMREAHRLYLEQSQRLLERAQTTRQHLVKRVLCEGMLEELDEFMRHAARQIDQVRRRVLEGWKDRALRMRRRCSPCSCPTRSGSQRARREFR
jgi:hypothetical protein